MHVNKITSTADIVWTADTIKLIYMPTKDNTLKFNKPNEYTIIIIILITNLRLI